MVPELVTVKVTEPAAVVVALSSIEYSLRVAAMAPADADGVDAEGVETGCVEADCDAALQAVARISTPTRPARAVRGRFMLSPILK
jgi:hypothetical protein